MTIIEKTLILKVFSQYFFPLSHKNIPDKLPNTNKAMLSAIGYVNLSINATCGRGSNKYTTHTKQQEIEYEQMRQMQRNRATDMLNRDRKPDESKAQMQNKNRRPEQRTSQNPNRDKRYEQRTNL